MVYYNHVLVYFSYQIQGLHNTPSIENNNVIGIREAAKILGVSADTVRRWSDAGKIPVFRDSQGKRYFHEDSLRVFNDKKDLTTRQAASYLGVSASTIRRLEKEGKLVPRRDEKGVRHYTKSILNDYKLYKSTNSAFINPGIALPATKPLVSPAKTLVWPASALALILGLLVITSLRVSHLHEQPTAYIQPPTPDTSVAFRDLPEGESSILARNNNENKDSTEEREGFDGIVAGVVTKASDLNNTVRTVITSPSSYIFDLYSDGTYFKIQDHTHDILRVDYDKNVTLMPGSTVHLLGKLKDANNSTGDTGEILTAQGAGKPPLWKQQEELSAGDISCDNCLNDKEIEDIYVLNNGDTITGSLRIQGTEDTQQLTLLGSSSQSQNIFEIRSSSDARLFSVSSLGDLATINGVGYAWPSSQGNSNTILSNDGSGTLSWTTLGSAVVTDDSLDFEDFQDQLDLDASTDIAVDGSEVFSITNTGTGNSFVVSDASSDSTPFVIDASGSVGIGDSTPDYLLDVAGALGVDGAVTLGDASGDTVTSNAASWTFANDTAVTLSGGVNGINFDANTLSIDATNNRVGIGTADPLVEFIVSNAGAEGIEFDPAAGTNIDEIFAFNRTGGAYDALYLSAANFRLRPGGSNTTAIAIDASGQMGISDLTPDYLLDVAGTFGTDGAVTFGDASADTVTSNAAAWTFANDTAVTLSGGVDGINFDSNTLSIDATNNRVGIGTASPAANLEVKTASGGSTIYATSGSVIAQLQGGSSYGWVGTQSAHDFYIGTGDASKITIQYSSGNVGIGDTTPAALLTVGSGDPFQVDTSGRISVGPSGVVSSGADTTGLTVSTTTLGQNSGISLLGNSTSLNGTLGIVAFQNHQSTFNSTKRVAAISAQTSASSFDAESGVLAFLTAKTTGALTEALRIDENQNVGIGDTTPDYVLDVAGTLGIDGAVTIGDASGDTVTFNAASLTFANDTAVTLSGGVDGINFDANTLSIDATNNRVGIGTAAPSVPLDVVGTIASNGTGTTYGLQLTGSNPWIAATQANSAGPLEIGTRNANGINIFTWDSTKMFITSTGNVGIADTSPDYLLELSVPTSSDSSFGLTDGDVAHGLTTLGETDAYLSFKPISSTAGGAKLQAFSDTDAAALNIYGYIGSTDPTDTTAAIKLIGAKKSTTDVQDLGASETVFQVANNDDTAAITVLGDGSVGVGVTPSQKLHVLDTRTTDGAVAIHGNSTGASVGTGYSAYFIKSGASLTNVGLYASASGATNNYAAIFNAGNVGIGDTSPDASLEVVNDGSGDSFLVADTNDGDTSPFVIDSSGRVGIGVTSSDAKLTVTETSASTFPVLRVNNIAASAETGIRFRTQDATLHNAHADLSWTATGNEAGSLVFRVPYTTDRLNILSTGNIGISDSSPDYLLELSASASSDSSFALSDGDVAHGLTSLGETDAYFLARPISSTAGGTKLEAFSDTDAAALNIYGYIGSTDPTDTTAAVKLIGAKKNTTGVQDLAAAETVFQVANNDDTAGITMLGNGRVGIGTPTPGDNSSAKVEIRGSLSTSTSEPILVIGRLINPGIHYGATAGFNVYNYSDATTEAYSQLDIRLGAGNSDAPSMTAMSLRGSSSGIGTGVIGIGTTAPDTALEINSSTGANLRLTYNDINGSAANYADFTMSSGGDLTIAPSGSDTSITGNLATSGTTTFGDASGDSVTSNAATWTFANDTAVTLSGGVDGINFDSNTLSIDATNNRVGIGTAAPGQTLTVNGTGLMNDIYLGGSTSTGPYILNNEIRGASSEVAFLDIRGGAGADSARMVMYGKSVGGTPGLILMNGGTDDNAEIRMNTSSTGNITLVTGGGKVGIGSSAPDRALEVNSSTGINLRLTYNDSDGSAATYTDFSVSSGGDLTVAPTGNDYAVTGQLSATDGLVTIVSAGACSDSTTTSDTNGTLCVDSSNGRIYYRYGGAWHYSAQTAGFQIPTFETEGISVGDYVMGHINEKLPDGALHGLYVKFDLASEIAKTIQSNPSLLTQFVPTPSLSLDDIHDLTVHGTLVVMGNTTFQKDVTIKGQLALDNQQVGQALIPKGGTSVDVTYTEAFTAVPLVNATAEGNSGNFWITKRSAQGFTIVIPHAVDTDVAFTWFALPVENPSMSVGTVAGASTSEPQETQPPVPEAPTHSEPPATPEDATVAPSPVPTEPSTQITPSVSAFQTPEPSAESTSVPETTALP